MKKMPKYLVDDIMKIYDIFYDENTSNIDLKDRRCKFKKYIRSYYSWLSIEEYNYIYNLIRSKEIDVLIENKKIVIERKYKNDIIKLFGKFSVDLFGKENIEQVLCDEEIKWNEYMCIATRLKQSNL